jgi:hypothetical protein
MEWGRRHRAIVAALLISGGATAGWAQDAAPTPQRPAQVAGTRVEAIRTRWETVVEEAIGKAVRKQREEKRLGWFLGNTVRAYDAVGKRNDAWDEDVRAALAQVARQFAMDARLSPGARADAVRRLRKAVEAGCDDPVVRYFEAAWSGTAPAAKVAELAQAVVKSPYPAARRALAAVVGVERMLERQLNEQTYEYASDLQWAAEKALPELARDPATPPDQLYFVSNRLVQHWVKMGNMKAVERVLAALKKEAPAGSPVLLQVEARRLIEEGYAARGGGYAYTVTAEGWKTLNEKMTKAEGLLLKAWALDDTNLETVKQMLTVKQFTQCDHAEFGDWFAKGMRANPDSYELCQYMLNVLEPKWGGSYDEMVAFGRQCLKGGRWASRIPFVLVDAHQMIAEQTGGAEPPYLSRQEVWDDVKAVYEGYLAAFPDEHYDRTRLAYRATRAGRWGEAAKILEGLGDKAVPEAAGGETALAALRADIRSHTMPAAVGAAHQVDHGAGRLAWWRGHLVGAYDAAGARGEAWDGHVHDGLEQAARLFGDDPSCAGDEANRAVAGLDAAIAAGCADPVVKYVRAAVRDGWLREEAPGAFRAGFWQSAVAVRDSKYPSGVKFWVTAHAVEFLALLQSGYDKAAVTDAADYAVGLLPEVVKEPGCDAYVLTEQCAWLLRRQRAASGGDGRAFFAKMNAAWGDAVSTSGGAAWVEAQLDRLDAERIAGGSTLEKALARMKPEERKRYDEALARHRGLLVTAWERDARDPRVCWDMLDLAAAVGRGGDPSAMDVWFRRAMDLNPNDAEACRKKMAYLHPARCGSVQEITQFAGECVESGKVDGEIPLMAAETVMIATALRPGAPPRPEAVQRFNAERGWWHSVELSYRIYLQAHPKAHDHRSAYAFMAAATGHWDVAEAQFQALGPNARYWVFGGREEFEKTRKASADSAAK